MTNAFSDTFVDTLESHLTYGRARWETPGAMAKALDPRTVQTPALDLIDQALVELANTPDGRLILMMPPQEGKSQRVVRRFAEWQLAERPDTRIAIVSYEAKVARRWGRVIRDDLREHSNTIGLRIRDDLSAQSEWELRGYDGGVVTVGIGGGLTGRAVDLLIIDDPIKDRAQADSETYRDRAFDWWTDVGSTRLAPGAPVALVLTRWHDDDLAGRLLAAEDGHTWKVLRIPALADHNPDAKPEDVAAGRVSREDPLGRKPGEYLESARGRTTKQWDGIRIRAGSRTWQSLYQGRPNSAEGDMFKRTDWQTYDTPLWVVRDDGSRHALGFDELLASWDMTFKDTKGTDYVVGQIWGRRGADLYLLDQVRGRWDFPETLRQFQQLAARWPQAVLKLVEDKANGPAVIASLRTKVPGIVAVEPHGSKIARASAASPLVEAHNVWLPDPELAPWVGDFIEEAAGFPTAAHDDQVDGFSQAAHRLILEPLMAGAEHDAVQFEEFQTVDDRGWYASPV